MLIHFTSSYENIESILDNECLWLKYCKEDFFNASGKVASAAVHPMVCFSNYDEEELPKQTITYGQFGVQFTWDWAKRNNISPVIYMQRNSMAASGLEVLLNERRKNTILSKKIRLSIIQIKCFTKNAIGYNSKMKDDNFDFTKEKEWRFVPSYNKIGNSRISQNRSFYNKDNNKTDMNIRIQSYPLKFTDNDINCIYIQEKFRDQFLTKFPKLAAKVKVSNWMKV